MDRNTRDRDTVDIMRSDPSVYKKDVLLYIVLSLAAAVHLFLLARQIFPWWDFGVYLGMGKYIYSWGQAGLWEPVRPLIWPVVVGFFWKIGIDPVFWTRVLVALMHLGIIVIVYRIAQQVFGRKAAGYAAVLVAFSSITLFMSTRLYADIPAVFFALLGFLLVLRRMPFGGGVFVGLAFMTKFTAGIFIVVVAIPLIMEKKWGSFFRLGAGFMFPVAPFLVANQIMYGSALFPFIAADDMISKVLSCNVLRKESWWFYPVMMVKDNIFFLFALLGGFLAARRFTPGRIAVIAGFILPFIYLMQLDCRIYRYSVLFIPFLAILAGYGLAKVLRREWWAVILIFSFAISMAYVFQEEVLENELEILYLSYSPGEGDHEVWASNPLIAVYTDRLIVPIYYPVFDQVISSQLLDGLDSPGSRMIYLDNCGGGIICPPGDVRCENDLVLIMDLLEEEGKLLYDAEYGMCYYRVFSFSRTS